MTLYKRGKRLYKLIRASEDWATTWYFLQDTETSSVTAVGKKVFKEEFTEVKDD